MSAANAIPLYRSRACCSTPSLPCCPATWMTSWNLAHSSSRAPHVASFKRRAPWLPPVTSKRRGGKPGVRGSKPSRKGTPVSTLLTLGMRSPVPGSVVQTAAALAAKYLVASPGRTSFSCNTYGIRRIRAAATAGAIT